MGYHTDFEGSVNLSKPLTDNQMKYLVMFSRSRRLKRDPTKITAMKKVNKECLELIDKLDLPLGEEGQFF